MKRFFSIEKIIEGAQKSIKRFPFVLAVAFIGVALSVYYVDINYTEQQDLTEMLNAIFVAFLGISFTFALAIIAERAILNTLKSLSLNALGIVILLGYYLFLPEEFPEGPFKYVFGFVLFFLSSHLFVAFGPFYEKDDSNAFWQFNKTILIQFLISVFYSGVLFAGLAIAIGAVSILFEVEIDEIRYAQLFFIVGGLFNTFHFLSVVPDDLEALNEIDDYPKELKIFSKYLLIPLVTVYIVILYAYTGKIIIEWEWPTGWVANLVLSFSIVGILSILLLHPIRNKSENKWIESFSKYFYYSLTPLIILLMLSIYRRISEYGVTINRYFVATLAVWLAFIVIYYIFSRSKNIKVIPFSLFVFAFFSGIGPFSAFDVSERNQADRLQEILEENAIYVNGEIRDDHGGIPFETEKQISSIVEYLESFHGEESLQELYEQPIEDVLEEQDYGSNIAKILSTMGLKFIPGYQNQEFENTSSSYVLLSADYGAITLNVEDYDWMLTFNQYGSGASEVVFSIDEDDFGVDMMDRTMLDITRNGEPFYSINISEFAEELFEGQNRNLFEFRLNADDMVLEEASESLEIRIQINKLQVTIEEGDYMINQIESEILINLEDD